MSWRRSATSPPPGQAGRRRIRQGALQSGHCCGRGRPHSVRCRAAVAVDFSPADFNAKAQRRGDAKVWADEVKRHADFARTGVVGSWLRLARTKAVSPLRSATALFGCEGGWQFSVAQSKRRESGGGPPHSRTLARHLETPRNLPGNASFGVFMRGRASSASR